MKFQVLSSDLFPEDAFALVGTKNVVVYLDGKFKELSFLEYQTLMEGVVWECYGQNLKGKE